MRDLQHALVEVADDLERWARTARKPEPAAAPLAQLPERWGSGHVEVVAEGAVARARPRPGFLPCPLCRDVGFTFVADERGYEYAKACRCAGLRERVDAYNRAGVPAEHAGSRFEGFEWPSNELMRSVAQFTKDPIGRGLLLAGTNGTGKTHLLSAVARTLTLRDAVHVRYVDWGQLVDEVHAALAQKRSVRHVTEPLTRATVLLVDELGKGTSGSDFHASIVEELLGGRLGQIAASTRQLGVMVATNLSIDRSADEPLSLAGKVGARVVSRLRGACEAFELVGEDYRQRRAAGRA